ncbi:MAG: hypothetical protein ACOC93_04250, partial [Planctomycetota bacterium]
RRPYMLDWLLEIWNDFSLGLFDVLLGWLLALPSDVVLFVVALGTVSILMAVRYLMTDQDLLRRAAQDTGRLKKLIRQAKRNGDKQAVKRHRMTKSQIALKKLRAEGKPLLVSILPIALLATWAMARLGYHPPRVDEPVQVVAYLPISSAGEVAHVVPRGGLRAGDSWVRPLDPVTDQGPPYSEARWTLRGEEGSYQLAVRQEQATYRCGLKVGKTTYAPPLKMHQGGVVTEVKMRPVKLFGLVPGVPQLFLPPWLVGYLLIVIPAYAGIRRLFRVY